MSRRIAFAVKSEGVARPVIHGPSTAQLPTVIRYREMRLDDLCFRTADIGIHSHRNGPYARQSISALLDPGHPEDLGGCMVCGRPHMITEFKAQMCDVASASQEGVKGGET